MNIPFINFPFIETRDDFKFDLFIWLEYGKFWSSIFLFIVFGLIIDNPKYSYVLQLNTLIVTTSIIALISVKYFDKDMKYTHYISILLDYSLFIFAIIASKNPYSTLFYWLSIGLVVTYYITNGKFTTFILIILLMFISSWPSPFWLAEELDYSFYKDGSFQRAFNTSLSVITLFLFFLGYIAEKVRRRNKDRLLQAIDRLKSEESFPEHNPNPIFEYFSQTKLKPRNSLAESFLNISSRKEIEILGNFAQAVLEDENNHTFQLYLAGDHYLINLVPINKKVNIYLTNISTLIETQENLRKKQQENYAIIDAIPGFVTWVDKDLRYLGVNSKFSKFLAKDKEEFIGKELGMVHSMENIELRELVKGLFDDSKVESTSAEINYSYGGADYWNYININKYNHGENAVLVSVDTTKLKESEQLIYQEQKRSEQNAKLAAFGEMSAGIAHEINNPLAVIKASVSRLKKLREKDRLTNDKVSEMIETTFYGVDRIQKIISGLKNLSRDGHNDSFELIKVSDILDDSFVLLSQKCRHLGIDLRLNYEKDLTVYCQRVQISQVLVIFVNNSLDAITDLDVDEKFIELSLMKKKNCFEISIIDSGKGISGEVQKRIFDPFFTTKAVGKGTGLGLSLAAKIIESHNGTLSIDNDCKHTKFLIRLPLNP